MVERKNSVQMACYFAVIFVVLCSVCCAQMVYSRALPYSPRYVLRRVPVRRSVEPAAGRIRLPLTRYFPQVDTQVAPLPYQLPPVSYRIPSDAVYAEELMQNIPVERNDDEDYAAYEYNEFSPVYADELYPQAQEIDAADNEGDLYNDLMVNYMLQEMQPRLEDLDQAELLEIQRRNQIESQNYIPQNNIPLINRVVEENRIEESPRLVQDSSPSSTTSAPVVPEVSSSVPASSTSSPVSAVTASSSSALDKPVSAGSPAFHTSPKIPMGSKSSQEGSWSDLPSEQRGQKEFPFFRTGKSYGQRSPLTALEEKLFRVKGDNHKDSLPLIEKLMASHRGKDPLTEQLDSLKLQNM